MPKYEHIVDLTTLNTLRLHSQASDFVVLNKVEQLDELGSIIGSFPRFLVIGGGSNLILPSHYSGLVIHNKLQGITIAEVEGERLVTAMAGENWDDFVAYCCVKGAHGLENLSLIPGTVGASPIQNIGAYGVEVKDFIQEVLVYDLETSKQVRLSNQDCEFRYRNSALKNNPRYIVLSVTFRLLATPELNLSYGDVAQRMDAIQNPTPLDLRNTIIAIRQAKLPDPKDLGNVGSFFHNPILPKEKVEELQLQYPQLPTFRTDNPGLIKVSAGWLIDNLGLKGFRKGNIGVYPKQALVLINYGDADQSELLQFAALIQAQVKEHYQVRLNIEPIVVSEEARFLSHRH